MKKVIALFGRGQVGKSFTIKKVYEILKEKYPNLKLIQQLLGGDIQIVIIINDIKIGIESQGDPTSRIFDSIPLFLKMECNIIICATRTRGGTVDLIESIEKNGFEIRWLKQQIVYGEEKQRENNILMANEIVDIVSELIK